MKTINFYRKNEFSNNLISVDVYVDNKKYKLSSDSSIEVGANDSNVEVYAKYLWVRSKKIYLDNSNKNYQIGIKPYMSDKWIFLQVTFIILLYILYSYFELEIFKYLFNIIGISFIIILFYFISFGKNRYFKLSISHNFKN